MTRLRVPLLVLVLLPLALLAPPAPAEAAPRNGTYVSASGEVHHVDVAWDGPCDGWGTLHVTFHFPDGSDWTVSGSYLGSTTPANCGTTVSRCLDCPPVPLAYSWSLRDPEGPERFAGAGTTVYDRYTYWQGPYEAQGLWMGGVLQFRGAGDWLG